ncbi:MAG: hypothetical protein EBS18_05805 [Actinobacteria bacterium]|nr:hypothetical protein [Actinomycetota bacterium]
MRPLSLIANEADLVKGFFAHLKKNFSRLVSFNGKHFDLPVLKYAAMKHEVEAGWFYDGTTFTEPPAPPPAPTPEPAPAPTKEELLAQLQALQAQIQLLET